MPKPRRGEKRDDFIKRCIPETIRDGAAKDGSQANAICNSIWSRRDNSVESKDARGATLNFLSRHKFWKAKMQAATGIPAGVPVFAHGPANEAIRNASGHYIDSGSISSLESLVTSDLVPRSFTALAGGPRIRTAQHYGRDHLVVPVVMLLGDAVLRPMHSKSPEFVPAELLAEAPSQWDGRPIVAVHPNQGRGSANNPRTLEAMKFGTIFHTEFRKGSLQAEAWIDPAQAEELGGDAKETTKRLSRGEQIEVSVGAWVALAEESGVSPSGSRYGARWASIASDHLAFGLAGHEGACSVDMGCGAPRSLSAQTGASNPSVLTSLTKEDSGMEKGLFSKIIEALGFKVAQDEITDSDIRHTLWQSLRSTEPAFDGIAEISQSGGWVVYAVSPDGGHKLIRRKFKISDEGKITFSGEAEEVSPRTRFEPLEGEIDGEKGTGKDDPVESLVGTLIDDSTTPYTSDDREALSAFSAERLQQLIEHLGAAPEGTSDDNDGGTDSGDSGATAAGSCGCQGTCSCNHDDESDPASAQRGEQEVSDDASHARSAQSTGDGDSSADPKHKEVTAMSDTKHPKAEFMGATKKELVNLIVASKESPFTEADWDVLADFEEPRLRSLLEHYTPEPEPQTEDEWLESAPDPVKNLVRRYQAEEAERRMDLIGTLKVSQDAYTLEQLKAKPTSELEALAKVLKLDRPRVDFSLRGGSPLRPEDYPSDPPNPYEAGLSKLREKLN